MTRARCFFGTKSCTLAGKSCISSIFQGAKLLAHRAERNKTHAEIASDYSDRLLALLWHFRLGDIWKEHVTVRTSSGWRSCEEVEDRLPDGRHAWLWRRSWGFFFFVPRSPAPRRRASPRRQACTAYGY